MINAGITSPSKAIQSFGKIFGIDTSDWKDGEDTESLRQLELRVNRSVLESLDLAGLREITSYFGPSLDAKISVLADETLTIDSSLDQTELVKYLEDSAPTDSFTLNVVVNKSVLVSHLWQWDDECRCLLFIFEEVVAAYLGRSISELEAKFYMPVDPRPLVLLVPDVDAAFTGPFCALIGGSYLLDASAVLSGFREQPNTWASMYDLCRKQISWQNAWIQHLNPLRVYLKSQRSSLNLAMPLSVNSLVIHFLNISLLFLAQRTDTGRDGLVSTFSSRLGTSQVPHLPITKQVTNEHFESADAIADILAWAYAPFNQSSRLALLQEVIVRELVGPDNPDNFLILLGRSVAIRNQLQWSWQTFISENFDKFLEEKRSLEAEVDKMVQALSDQSSALTKSMTDAMLGAVVAVVVAIAAAASRNPFSLGIFSIGVGAYITYVTVFHLIFARAFQEDRFNGLIREYEIRQAHFATRLSSQQIDEIVENRIDDAVARWERWAGRTAAAYMGIVLVLIISIYVAVIVSNHQL
ncbi:hypothetical protein BH09CHL1_BH09CHL1_16790 [soil metagenome]